MAFEVKLVGKRKEAGQYGEYDVITCEDKSGNNKDNKIFGTLFKKYPNLRKEISEATVGNTYLMNVVKNEKGYSEITSFKLSTKSSTSSAPTPVAETKKDDYWGDKDIGMQVGNALTNACTILGMGASLEQVEKTAESIIAIGNRLKNKLKSGEIKEETALTKAVDSSAGDPFEGADVPF